MTKTYSFGGGFEPGISPKYASGVSNTFQARFVLKRLLNGLSASARSHLCQCMKYPAALIYNDKQVIAGALLIPRSSVGRQV